MTGSTTNGLKAPAGLRMFSRSVCATLIRLAAEVCPPLAVMPRILLITKF